MGPQQHVAIRLRLVASVCVRPFIGSAPLPASWLQPTGRGYGLPADIIKGVAVSCSGLYDLRPVHLSARREFLAITDDIEQAFSPQRHVGLVNAPVVSFMALSKARSFNDSRATSLRLCGPPGSRCGWSSATAITARDVRNARQPLRHRRTRRARTTTLLDWISPQGSPSKWPGSNGAIGWSLCWRRSRKRWTSARCFPGCPRRFSRSWLTSARQPGAPHARRPGRRDPPWRLDFVEQFRCIGSPATARPSPASGSRSLPTTASWSRTASCGCGCA